MHQGIRNDECLICEGSLLRGLDLFHLVVDDVICYKCRSELKGKFRLSNFSGYRLLSFYEYDDNVSQLLIRFKDLLDKPLGLIFIKEWLWLINLMFKDYTIVLIPSSKKLKDRRGFNHLEYILNGCKLIIIDPFEKEDSVQRFKKDRRDLNFKFRTLPEDLDKVIIFDDVITSGSSMQAAIDLLSPITKKIILITIATNIK